MLNIAELARDWLSVLEASGQLVLLEPWFNNAGKRMINPPKLYFRDAGLICLLLGLDSPSALERSPFIGTVWESFVLGQMLRAKKATGTAARIFFWRDVLPLLKVREQLGKKAAPEHWITCRTARPHFLPDENPVRVLNGTEFTDWFPP